MKKKFNCLLWCRLLRALATGQTGVMVTVKMFILIAVEAVFLHGMRRNHWRHDSGTTVSLAIRNGCGSKRAISTFPRCGWRKVSFVRALGPGTCQAKSRNLTDIRALNKSGAKVGANSWPLQSSTYLPLRQFFWRHSPASLPPRRGTRACIDPHLITVRAKINTYQVDASRGSFLWQ